MQYFYLIIIGLAASVSLAQNQTVETKDKRQINQHSRTFSNRDPSNRSDQQKNYQEQHQQQQQLTQIKSLADISANTQSEEIPTEYYNYLQGVALDQERNPQHYQRQETEPIVVSNQPNDKQLPPGNKFHPSNLRPYTQSGTFPQPLQILTEEQYLELVKKSETIHDRQKNQKHSYSSSYNAPGTETIPKKQISTTTGLENYKKAQKVTEQASHQPITLIQPKSYRQSYINPLGDFSLEKELAKLEASNKAIEGHMHRLQQQQVNDDIEKQYDFKPSPQILNNYYGVQNKNAAKQQQSVQSYSFLKPEHRDAQNYAIQRGSHTAQVPNFVNGQYIQEESRGLDKPIAQQEYEFQYIVSDEPLLQSQKAEQSSQPKYQYALHASDASNKENSPVQLVQPPQLQRDHISELHYNQQSSNISPIQQYYKSNPNAKPSIIQQSHVTKPQSLKDNTNSKSHSSIYVSQSTGISHNQQSNNHYQQLNSAQSSPQSHHFKNPSIGSTDNSGSLHMKEERPPIGLPPPNPDRPLTQEEFQALVDAGYKVTAIPVPVPVPVSVNKYNQHLIEQQQQQQQQQQFQFEQHQPSAAPNHGRIVVPQIEPKKLPHTKQVPQRLQQNHFGNKPQHHYAPHYRAQAQSSNKHLVRYHPQSSESVLSSYLRPLLEQYSI